MTKRSQLKKYIESLTDISDIMTAMKNLSLVEINKLTKFLTTQGKVVNTLEVAGIDFFSFFPKLLPAIETIKSNIYILIGSERGFCGSFNDIIIAKWQADIQDKNITDAKLVIIGRKLAMKLEDDSHVIKIIDGPSTAEEIPAVILSLIDYLENMPESEKWRSENWQIIYNEIDGNLIQSTLLSPFIKLKGEKTKTVGFAPYLNLSPKEFLSQFLEQYLFAILHNTFYQSLMAENHQRLQHMDGAITRLEKKCTQLTNQLNILRQEEITEEIEVILLSAEALLQEKIIDSN